MADRDYSLKWLIDPSGAVAGADRLRASLLALEQVIDRVDPKIKKLGVGSSRSLNNTTAAAQALTAQLGTLTTQAGGATTALNGLGNSAGAGTGHVGGMSRSVGGLGMSLMALSAAQQVLDALVKETERLEAHWKKLAEEAEKFREELRELASIKGESGPSNKVMGDVLDLALKIGDVPEKAKELAQSYENFGPSVRDKGHYQPTAGTAEQLESDIVAETGVTARRLGLDMKKAGETAGTMGLFHTFHNKEEAMDKLGGALWGISRGTTNYTTGVPALNRAAAKLVDPKEAEGDDARPGRIPGFDEAGVYFGVMSLGTGGSSDRAGHRMVQVSRLLNPNPNKEAGKQALGALGKAGVTDGMDDMEKLIQVGRHLKTLGPNEGDPLSWLQDNGFGSEATREATAAALKNVGLLESGLAEVRRGGFGKKVLAANEKNVRTDRTADAGRLKAASGVMDKVEGEQHEWLERAKDAAEQRRRLFDPYHNSGWGEVVIRGTAPAAWAFSDTTGEGYHRETQRDFGAMPTLGRAAKKAGVDLGRFPGLSARSYPTRSRAFAEAAEAIKAKGVDPLEMAPITDEARRRVQQMKGADGSGGAPPAIGPGASLGGDNGKLLDVNTRQLVALENIHRELARSTGGGSSRGHGPPLGIDADSGGPARRGSA